MAFPPPSPSLGPDLPLEPSHHHVLMDSNHMMHMRVLFKGRLSFSFRLLHPHRNESSSSSSSGQNIATLKGDSSNKQCHLSGPSQVAPWVEIVASSSTLPSLSSFSSVSSASASSPLAPLDTNAQTHNDAAALVVVGAVKIKRNDEATTPDACFLRILAPTNAKGAEDDSESKPDWVRAWTTSAPDVALVAQTSIHKQRQVWMLHVADGKIQARRLDPEEQTATPTTTTTPTVAQTFAMFQQENTPPRAPSASETLDHWMGVEGAFLTTAAAPRRRAASQKAPTNATAAKAASQSAHLPSSKRRHAALASVQPAPAAKKAAPSKPKDAKSAAAHLTTEELMAEIKRRQAENV